jgi:hypothetical protein
MEFYHHVLVPSFRLGTHKLGGFAGPHGLAQAAVYPGYRSLYDNPNPPPGSTAALVKSYRQSQRGAMPKMA